MHLRELLSDSLAGASLYKKNTGKHEKIKKIKKNEKDLFLSLF